MTRAEFVSELAYEFELAFLTTGLDPVARQWGDGVKTACMATAFAAAEPPEKEAQPVGTRDSTELVFSQMKSLLAQAEADGINLNAIKVSGWNCSLRSVKLALDQVQSARQRAIAALGKRFPQFDHAWWSDFMQSCIMAFDAVEKAGAPTKLGKTESEACALGAAVGALVRERAFASAPKETVSPVAEALDCPWGDSLVAKEL